ncbi:hypothetical protein ACFQ3P_35090 [Paraburkholderia sabiae]|uniref:Transposase n=1 Tax=Paraburkholderia sabiae TaxID=273251 RepID=A0ABU9QLP7_9BURK|nr:hypothetical protein [Paraburkholderia sabiae]WJZ73426.1 hypothetical protein QEN71_25315 [Paraburkholderia sabiae]
MLIDRFLGWRNKLPVRRGKVPKFQGASPDPDVTLKTKRQNKSAGIKPAPDMKR